jgi:hypothetical protein
MSSAGSSHGSRGAYSPSSSAAAIFFAAGPAVASQPGITVYAFGFARATMPRAWDAHWKTASIAMVSMALPVSS